MPDFQPLISVCIANFNGMRVIDDCIASVKSQKVQAKIEIIVHDDLSTDGSVSHIRDHHPDVRLIESTENVGYCISNNRMLSIATGQFFLLLNNDATLLPEALATLYQAAQNTNQSTILGLPQYNAHTGELLDIGSLLDPFLNPIPNLDLQKGEVGLIMGACLWIPRSLWLELGGFPEWMGSIGEDLYLCTQARIAGYPVIALGQSGYNHLVGHSFGGGKVVQDGLKTTLKRRKMSECNKTFTMIITFPTTLLIFILPIHLFLLFLEGIFLSFARWQSVIFYEIYWNVIWSIFNERVRLWKVRKVVQSQRKISLLQFIKPIVFFPRKITLLLKHGIPIISK